jgi:hypothetical protein
MPFSRVVRRAGDGLITYANQCRHEDERSGIPSEKNSGSRAAKGTAINHKGIYATSLIANDPGDKVT